MCSSDLVNIIQEIGPDSPLFSGSVRLKELRLHSVTLPALSQFDFPNLTSFELSASVEGLSGLQLLDFLKAPPTLRAVCAKIIAPPYHSLLLRLLQTEGEDFDTAQLIMVIARAGSFSIE